MKKINIALGIVIALVCGASLYVVSTHSVCDDATQVEETTKVDTVDEAAKLALSRYIYDGDAIDDVELSTGYTDDEGRVFVEYTASIGGEKDSGCIPYSMIENFMK